MNTIKIFRSQLRARSMMLVLTTCACSMGAHAALITDNSERRVYRHQGNAHSPASIERQNATLSPSNEHRKTKSDGTPKMRAQKQHDLSLKPHLAIEENTRVRLNQRDTAHHAPHNHTTATHTKSVPSMDFNVWLNRSRHRAKRVAEYQRYLSARVGASKVPPLSELLTTARSWRRCGYEPYQLPPQALWANIVPTLRLYNALKQQGILPPSSQIRSVYRSPGLNACAGGADSSKHMNASAMDIWVPEYDDNLWQRSQMQDRLCQFWHSQGADYNFGLGLYATGAVHLDTDGHRKWGFHHAPSNSACRN